MLIHCAPACQSCGQFSFLLSCPIDDYEEGIWQKGDLEATFQRIATEYANTGTVVSDDPWLIQLEDFLTPEECQTLINLGGARGYKRSENLADKMNFDGATYSEMIKGRTSQNAWCDEDDCLLNPNELHVLEKNRKLDSHPTKQW